MVKVEINFSNKFVYLVISVLAVLVIAGVTIAYGTIPVDPSVMGHTCDEIEEGCVGGSGGFGDWEAKNLDEVYQASEDGFVVVNLICKDFSATHRAFVYSGVESSSGILRGSATCSAFKDLEYETDNSVTIPVKKGDYWKVNETHIGAAAITTRDIWWVSA